MTPNTRVDVLLTMENQNTGGEPATRIIMQDMRVLAAGQSIQPDKEGKPRSVPVVTFLVSPEQAETLALAAQQGSIQLALRNQLDTNEVKTAGARRSALMRGAGGAPPRRTAARACPAGLAARAAVAGGRSVSGWRTHPHEVLSLTSTR